MRNTPTTARTITKAQRRIINYYRNQAGLVAVTADGTLFEPCQAACGVPATWHRNNSMAQFIKANFLPASEQETTNIKAALQYVHTVTQISVDALLNEITSASIRRRVASCCEHWQGTLRELLARIKKLARGTLSAADQKRLCDGLWILRDCAVYEYFGFELYDVNTPVTMAA